MKKAKASLIALFFIANLFADCDFRFSDGTIAKNLIKENFIVERVVVRPPLKAVYDGIAYHYVCYNTENGVCFQF